MKGDFSRSTFKREKHYSKVNIQQGRVNVDADPNEQADIISYFQRSLGKEILGNNGFNIKDSGFKITPIFEGTGMVVPGPNYGIGEGKCLVGGIICENEKSITAKNQPDLITSTDEDNPALPKEAGTYLVYLDIFERHITFLEDEQIREAALGGADTSTRNKIVWQVKTKKIGDLDANFTCLSEIDFWNTLTTRQPNATMVARTSSVNIDSEDPCILPPDAKYRGLENQLYRFEIHHPGDATRPLTVKWSRNNAFLTTKIESVEGNAIITSNLGKDKLLGFEVGDWIEITDDEKELLGKSGIIARITDIDDLLLSLDPHSIEEFDPLQNNISMSARPKIRKWDMKGGLLEIPNNKRSDSDTADDSFWFPVEDGIEIKFGLGEFRTGDYWNCAARTVTGEIEWPREGDVSISQSPVGITHHYARLAIIKYDGTKIDTNIIDCRRKFPDLTSLANLHYVGGDGQTGKKNTSLLLPLQVGVSIGQYPLEGISIEFEVKNGDGNVNPITTKTDSNGISRCTWTLGETEPQQVIAVMKNELGQVVHLPIWFNASITKDEKIGNCTISVGPADLADGGSSIGSRIKELKPNGGKICLAAGQYMISDTITINELNNITIEGTGNGTKLVVVNQESALHFVKCKNIHLNKLEITSTKSFNRTINQTGLNGVVTFSDSNGIKLTHCKLKTSYQLQPTRSCISIYGNPTFPSSQIYIGNCEFEIGSMQIGILATNVVDLTIENNYMTTMSTKGKKILLSKVSLFKNNPQLKLLVHRLGSRGLSVETFTKVTELEVELIKNIKTGMVQYDEGKHEEALKSMNRAKKIGDEIDEIVKQGKTISQPFLENEIYAIFDRAKLERINVKDRITEGINHATNRKHDEAKKAWMLASAKEDGVNELVNIGVSLSKRSIDENKIKTDLTKNQDLVYSAATWNFDKTRFRPNELQIIRGIRQDISTAYQGIVIGGIIAEKIKIQNNIINRTIHGIHIGVSNNIEGIRIQKTHVAKNILISNNIIKIEFWNIFPKQKHGIFIGNADIVHILNNQLIFNETNHSNLKSPAGPASEGIRIFGYQGSMLRIIGNNINGARIGISLTILGYPPKYFPTYGLWLLRENVVTKYISRPFYLTGKSKSIRNNIRFTNRDNVPEFTTPLTPGAFERL